MRDLRVSLTDRCNFRCLYCLPETEQAANFYRTKFDAQKNPNPVPFSFPEWKPRSEILRFEEIERLGRDGLTRTDLDDTKKAYIKNFELGLSDDALVAAMLRGGLYLHRTLDFDQRTNDKIKALTLDEVNAVAKKYIKPAALVSVAGVDTKKADAAK